MVETPLTMNTPCRASREQVALDFLDIDIQCCRDRGCGEFAAHDARYGEKVTVTVAELVDLAIDEASDVVRDRHELVDGLIPTGMGKLVDDAAHEQWIAACPIEQQRRKARGQRRSLSLLQAEPLNNFQWPPG